MALIRAMVVMQGATNVPEDRFINTFFFQQPGLDAAAAAAVIHPDLTAFYNTATTTISIANKISSFVNRAATVRYYDMSQAEPRVPHIEPLTLTASSGDAPLPEEVAIVASFHGGPPVTPRTRGRVYLGPLNGGVVFNSTGGVKVAVAFRTHVCSRMEALAGSDAGWVVNSPTSNITTTVVGGFCDDAFDTMRKRGPKTTARSIWPVPV